MLTVRTEVLWIIQARSALIDSVYAGDVTTAEERTKTMKSRAFWIAVASVAAVAILVVGLGASAADAAPIEGPVTTSSTEVALVATGYNQAVAQAHGFKIVTDPDGSWESVAVTPAAMALQAGAGGAGGVAVKGIINGARVTVHGNCGSSFLDVSRSGNHVTDVTGYSVSEPVWMRVGWTVMNGGIGVWAPLSWPNGTSGASWSGTGGFFTSAHGSSFVLPSSSVIMINGEICGSGSPTGSF